MAKGADRCQYVRIFLLCHYLLTVDNVDTLLQTLCYTIVVNQLTVDGEHTAYGCSLAVFHTIDAGGIIVVYSI